MSTVRPVAGAPAVVGILVGLALLLAACGSSSTGSGSAAGSTSTASNSQSNGQSSAPAGVPSTSLVPRTTGSPVPAVPASSPRSAYSSSLKVTVSDAENGSTLTVNRGADIYVTLHSTYWQFQQASAPRVLVQAAPVLQGDPPSRAGIPGSGKGTVRESYHAAAPGTATITATRTSCGEAMRCTAGQGLYRITVIVR